MYKFTLQKVSLNKELVKARIALKNIETLTYNFTDSKVEHATSLSAELNELYCKYEALLPKCEGIPNANIATQYIRRKVQKAKCTLNCSSLRRSKPKRLKGISKRVGAKADRLRKEAMVCYTVNNTL